MTKIDPALWQIGDTARIYTWDDPDDGPNYKNMGSAFAPAANKYLHDYLVIGPVYITNMLPIEITYDCGFKNKIEINHCQKYSIDTKYTDKYFYLVDTDWIKGRIPAHSNNVKTISRIAKFDGAQCYCCQDQVYMATNNASLIASAEKIFVCRYCRNNNSKMTLLQDQLMLD